MSPARPVCAAELVNQSLIVSRMPGSCGA